ncbi:MAG: flippase [Sphingobacteriaceae bacterium]
MTLPSVKHNFLYNLTNTVLKIVFPLLVFPYVSRVLEPEGIGRINYAEAFASYFVLFSSLGIPIYGLREIAKYRSDLTVLRERLGGILCINFFFVILSYLVLGCLLYFQVIRKENNLILINSSLILFSLIEMEWYFQGTENYKFITIRNLILKTITMVLIFTTIHSKDDVLFYAVLMVVGIGGNSLFNFFYIMRSHGKAILGMINLSFIKKAFSQHFKTIVITSTMALAGSIYLSLDVIMLGQISSDTQVGLYSASMKIVRVIITVVMALSTVLLPRASFHVMNEEMEEFKKLIKLSFDFICFLALPCMAGMLVLSKPIIFMFSGNNFLPAHHVIEILSVLTILVSLNNLLGMQILYPLNKERIFLVAIIFGAIINVCSNLVLIPLMAARGAAISSLLAEGTIFIILFWFSKQFFSLHFILKPLKYVVATLVMSVVIYSLDRFFNNFQSVIYTIITIAVGAMVYVLMLLVLKETYFLKPALATAQNFLKR